MFSSLFLFLSIFWILTKTQSTLYWWSESSKCQSFASLSWCLVLIRYILMCREMVARLPSGVHLTSGARSHMNIQEYKVKPCPELSRVAACCPKLSLSLYIRERGHIRFKMYSHWCFWLNFSIVERLWEHPWTFTPWFLVIKRKIERFLPSNKSFEDKVGGEREGVSGDWGEWNIYYVNWNIVVNIWLYLLGVSH